ncbi:MAG: hypothetical protein B7733_22755 [Myxococcales bacterium FL481]|nr:MAG: hypothetical protein B7733_22755 [Myxococcales bacterium FL481]
MRTASRTPPAESSLAPRPASIEDTTQTAQTPRARPGHVRPLDSDETTRWPIRVSTLSVDELQQRFQVRAVAYHGLRAALAHAGRLDQVQAAVPPSAAQLLRRPPTMWRWAPALAFQHVLWALEQVTDATQMQRIGLDTVTLGPLRWALPAIRASVAATRRDPHALLSGLCRGVTPHLRGITLTSRRLGPRRGELGVRYEWLQHVTPAAFVFWEGVASLALDLARVTGVVVTTSSEIADEGVIGILHVDWD